MNDPIFNTLEANFEDAIIPVASEGVAMDWSLVLASQGITAMIQSVPDSGVWQLQVPRSEYGNALRILRLYKRENRPRPWQSPVPWTGLLFDWRAGAWVILWIVFYVLQVTQPESFAQAGMMNSQAVWNGQWWRLFTAVMLHGSIPHLASNGTTGLLLLGLAMGSFGAGWAVLAAFVAGAIGNLAGLFLYQHEYLGLGASGMVMGALGLLTSQSFATLRDGGGLKEFLRRGVLGGVLLLILLGLNPQSDVVAHLGGFLGGAVLGLLLLMLPTRLLQSTGLNRWAELVSAGLIILCWWRALRG